MSLTPISRDSMRTLKAMKDEERRVSLVKNLVEEIYINAEAKAATSTETVYQHRLYAEGMFYHNYNFNFYRTNMSEILRNVQNLFPGCAVSHSILVEARKRVYCN